MLADPSFNPFGDLCLTKMMLSSIAGNIKNIYGNVKLLINDYIGYAMGGAFGLVFSSFDANVIHLPGDVIFYFYHVFI